VYKRIVPFFGPRCRPNVRHVSDVQSLARGRHVSQNIRHFKTEEKAQKSLLLFKSGFVLILFHKMQWITLCITASRRVKCVHYDETPVLGESERPKNIVK